ncbi:MAG: DIP1984 family protein, partial [Lachnospiraceae bacterium]|nr:DIP1984 family protein [Lachnospiraceae bacterium]
RSGEETITDLIAHRDCLKMRIQIMRSFLNASSEKVARYTKTEIRVLSTVPVAKLQKQVDEYSADLRRTDETIQGLNWTTELL